MTFRTKGSCEGLDKGKTPNLLELVWVTFFTTRGI